MRLLVLSWLVGTALAVVPEQVHLSTQGDMTAMAATWITFSKYSNAATKSYVIYGTNPGKLDQKNDVARITTWTDGGKNHIVRYTHRIRMTNLVGGTRYYYRVGSDEGLSPLFNFTALDANWRHMRVAIFGDFGLSHDTSLQQLKADAAAGKFDVIFHIGDIAYDLDDSDGKVGDSFMKAIEPIAASVPYMVIAGNHESNQGFSHFIHRFTTPITDKPERDNQFWSFDVGPVHFFGLSSEYYCYKMYKQANDMWNWLNEDLAKTTKPWIVGFMHRPMYCSASCDYWEDVVTRKGDTNLPAIEPLLGKYGVDFLFTGHKHYYERLFPVYNGLAFNTQNPKKIHNAKAPIHVVTGSAGCHTHITKDEFKQKPFSAYANDIYGYSVLEIVDGTTINSYFVHAETGHDHDEWTLTKDSGYRPRIG